MAAIKASPQVSSASSTSSPEATGTAEPLVVKKKGRGGRKALYATQEERKMRNRAAQAAFRERRSVYIKQLEVRIKRTEEQIYTLQQTNRKVNDEGLMLRYKNSLLERILYEKGIDVEAELRRHAEQADLSFMAQPPQEPQAMPDVPASVVPQQVDTIQQVGLEGLGGLDSGCQQLMPPKQHYQSDLLEHGKLISHSAPMPVSLQNTNQDVTETGAGFMDPHIHPHHHVAVSQPPGQRISGISNLGGLSTTARQSHSVGGNVLRRGSQPNNLSLFDNLASLLAEPSPQNQNPDVGRQLFPYSFAGNDLRN